MLLGASRASKMGSRVSLIRATPRHSAQLLYLHVLYHILKFDVLFLKLEILAFDPLKVPHPALELFVQVADP